SVIHELVKYFATGDRKTALAILEANRGTVGHTLPHSLNRLEDKVRQYQSSGFDALISGKVGNRNTLKITAEASQQIIALKRSRTPVYTDWQIFNKFNSTAAEKGWEQLKSIRSLKQFLNQPRIEPLWYDAVHGELKSAQRYSRRHQTELPKLRDALWYGDGTRLNLYYRDDDGKMRTKMVYEVMDAYSEVLLGYFISDTEDHEAQYHAYRMAIQTALHKPYEIVHDNQGGHKKVDSQGLFKQICHIHRPTSPHNPESKTIESAFGRFQANILHQDWRFTGQNITSKKMSSRPNLEFINENKDKLYTLTELKNAYSEARKQWNESAHPATGIPRIEMYRNSKNPKTPEVSPSDMVEIFWLITGEPCTFTSQGIEITVKGNKYRYEVFSSPGVPDHEWRRAHTLQRFYTKYDPYDMTSVRLYRKDDAGELRFERVAEPYMKIHRAKQEQEDGEDLIIRREREANLNDRMERQIAARTIEAEHGVAPEQNGLRSPKLNIPAAKRDELQRQCERRTKKYSRNPEEYQTARVDKVISLTTYDELEEETDFDTKKAANKL
ncbi:MAG: Mu transposase C-terminal domain-containing protein, partial [Prevotellaceae bacterium]|nr:Mu transposase C-terminal domain-containing protein [Prevotellaceae bacterium]